MTNRSDLLRSIALKAASNFLREACESGELDPRMPEQDNRTAFYLAVLDLSNELEGRAKLIRLAPDYENDKGRMGRMLIAAQKGA